MPALGFRRRKRPNGIIERSRSRIERSSPIVSWHNYGVWAKSTKFGSEATLCIDLQIEKSSGDCGAGPEREQDDEEAAAVGAEKPAEDAPEHLPIAGAGGCHHSPLSIGAGS